MRVVLCSLLVGLALPGLAAAHTDGGRQLEFAWPADGTITSPFGRDGMRWHPGLDIGILRSLSVRAAAGGVVTRTGYVVGYEGYGNVVVVNMGGGFVALYAHLAQPLVQQGDQVIPDEPIGVAGCTGMCTGTHLHFEVRYRGLAIDPLPLIALGYNGASRGG